MIYENKRKRRMATASLVAMALFTGAMFLLILKELRHFPILVIFFISLAAGLLLLTWELRLL